MMWMDEISLKA